MATSGTTRTVSTGGITFDTHEYRAFARELRKAEPELAAKLRTQLRTSGAIIGDEAKLRASEFSSSIAATIRVRVAGLTVTVVAGGKNVPIAALEEAGNKGLRTTGHSFKHPVFGNRKVWVEQPMHPYLVPAFEHHQEKFEAAVVDAVNATIEELVR